MIKFSDSEFDALEFNIIPYTTEKDVKKDYPQIYKWEEFKEQIPFVKRLKVIKYIVACYDKNSPLVKVERNVMKRKSLSAELCDFERNKDRTQYKRAYKEILEGKNRQVNNMIVRFIIHQKDLMYSQYVSMCESYYQLMSLSLDNQMNEAESTSDIFKILDEKNKINRQMSKLAEEIEAMYDKVFLEDRSLTMTVYDGIETNLDTTPIGFPEIYAKKLEELKNEQEG